MKQKTAEKVAFSLNLTIDKAEALFLANALKTYALDCPQQMKGRELAGIEKAGRKFCAKVVKAMEAKGQDGLDVEQGFIDARNEFCGIGEDEDL